MKHTITTLILTLLVSFACAGSSRAQHFLSYEPEVVELDGQLVVQSKYGPPNYGEDPKTDLKVRVPVLVLRQRVSVIGDRGDGHNSQTVYGARQIQLAFGVGETSHKALIGKQVVVTGTLFHAHTGHHYTDVVMTVRSIERKPVGQRQFAVCGVYSSYYNPREGAPTSQFLEAQFLAFFAGEPTQKSIKLSDTGLIIKAALDYAGSKGSREGKPVALAIAIVLSDKEKNALDSEGKVEAITKYSSDWRLSVRHQQLVGEARYTLTLSCSDGNTQKKR